MTYSTDTRSYCFADEFIVDYERLDGDRKIHRHSYTSYLMACRAAARQSTETGTPLVFVIAKRNGGECAQVAYRNGARDADGWETK